MALVLDGNGTMTVGNGDITGLVAGALPSTVIGAGAVLQVVSVSNSTSITITADFPQNSGITLAITPTSTSSKILAFASISSGTNSDGSNANKIGIFGIKNNTSATTLGMRRVGANLSATGSDWFGETSLIFLDSPNSTSTQTYEILAGRLNSSFNNGVAINTGYGGVTTTFTLMEIAA